MSMEERIKEHIDRLFISAPSDSRIADTKNEIYLNTLDRYRDLLSQGKNEEEAYRSAIAGIGDVSDLIRSFRAQPTPPQEPLQARQPVSSDSRKTCRQAAISYLDTLLWMVTLTLYFLLSFLTMAWYITWVIFLITPAIQNIIRAVSDLSMRGRVSPPYQKSLEQKRIMNSIGAAVWTLTVAGYILISFYTGMWHLTWVMFFFPPALESIISLCLLLKKQTNQSEEGGNPHA